MIERLFYLLEVIWAMLFVWWWVMGSICQKEPFIFSPFTVKVFPLVRRQDLCSMKVLWILGLHRVPGPGGCSQCKGKPKASWWAWAISGFQTKIKYNGLYLIFSTEHVWNFTCGGRQPKLGFCCGCFTGPAQPSPAQLCVPFTGCDRWWMLYLSSSSYWKYLGKNSLRLQLLYSYYHK